jgi:hypothetical protein
MSCCGALDEGASENPESGPDVGCDKLEMDGIDGDARDCDGVALGATGAGLGDPFVFMSAGAD